ncbi:MAG: SGNH/GDSL hydrolase family protein [Clostridia bacterium]|nr:SGNH/GDSL hydrolase family protein [Clostridia bacterium]
MLFQNIEFHNVAEIVPYEEGWKLYRIPAAVRAQANAGLANSAAYSTGIELRMRILGDYADVHLRSVPIAEGQMAYLYYGSIQGGWQQSSFIITPERTTIRIPRPGNLAQLQQITDSASLPFSPEVVRLVLPYGNIIFLGIEGDVAPPMPEHLPKATLLSYGSSITHGSLALASPYTYPFRIAQKLGCDYLNLGCAGTCHCEKAMADWLVSRKDWHFATLEMGVNMLGFTEKEFEERIDTFTGILADDGRPVFATSIFHFNGDQSKADVFRAIVRKYAAPRMHFTDGLALLERPEYISQDMVHPSLEGIEQVSRRWYEIIHRELPQGFITRKGESR